MRLVCSAATSLAGAALLTMTAAAQTPAQTPSATQSATTPSTEQGQQVTIVGCVQRESEYREAHDKGGAGVAGSGVGAQNEFVLTDATMSTPETSGTSSTATGTSGSTAGSPGASAENAFELTGPNEGQVQQHVGRRVEITGRLKAAETSATGTTGGPTAGTPPSGVDVMSKDLKLRELEVTSVRESTGSCPPAVR